MKEFGAKRATFAFSLALVLILLLAFSFGCAPKPTPSPAELDSLRTLLKGYVERGEVSGVSLLLAHHGNIVFEEAYGWADFEAQKPFTTDTIVSIASTTKPLSATCLMILVDEGKISLDDPVSKYLPAFGELTVQGTGAKAASPTIRQLLSHTSGLFAHPMTAAEMDIVYYPYRTLDEVVDLIAKEPLEAQPGSRFAYGPAVFELMGRIVEIVSGQPFDVFMQQRLLTPLGMVDTSFSPSGDKAARVAAVHQPYGDGFRAYLRYSPETKWPLPFVAGRLYSTLRDMAAFLQMHLNGGVYDSTRILSSSAVAEMQKDQGGESTLGSSPYLGRKCGLAWFRDRVGSGGRTLSVSHGGGFGTIAWIDIDRDLIGVLFTNIPPDLGWKMQQAVREKVLEIFPSEMPITPAPIQMTKEYVNEEHGFSVKYPERYAEEAATPPAVFRVRAPTGLPVLEVIIEDVEQGTTFSDLEQLVEAYLKGREWEDIEFVSEKETTLADGITPARELVAEGSKKGYPLKGLYLAVIKENRWIVVRLVTITGSWLDLKAEIMQIAYTLQFK